VIREYEDADAEAAAALLAGNSPWLWTAAGLRHRLAALPPRARRASWVAEEDGEMVGWAEAEFDWAAERDDIGTLYVLVSPAHRRRGIGAALFERAAAHLERHAASELRSWSFPDGDAFLERRGFTRARHERMSAVDPRSVDTSALEDLPNGVRIAPLADLEDRLEDVHSIYAEAAADMPADHRETNLPFDEWLAETVAEPDLSREGSMVALVDGSPAALSWLKVDRVRGIAEHDLTGTARAYRRRGLARLAKLAALRWAAENDVVRVQTGNDATNAAMLAINDELGFRPFAVESEWVKPLS
jgi:GNAT superfamily N-acetyltransferase